MSFPFSLFSRWTGRQPTPTTPIIARQQHPFGSTSNLTSTSTPSSPGSPKRPTNTTPSGFMNIPLEMHTQGIRETLNCVDGGESPSSLLALRRLQAEAESRARTRRGEADNILRALAVVRSSGSSGSNTGNNNTPATPRVSQVESGQDRYRDDSSSGEEDEEKEEEVTGSSVQKDGAKENVADAGSRMTRTNSRGISPGGGGSRPFPPDSSREATGEASGLCSRTGATTPGAALPVPTDEERRDGWREAGSPARSPSDTSEDGREEDLETLARRALDAYRELSLGSPTSSDDASGHSSDDEVHQNTTRPITALGWYEDGGGNSSTESIAAQSSSTEESIEEQRNAQARVATVVGMASGRPRLIIQTNQTTRLQRLIENTDQAVDIDVSGGVTLEAGTYAFKSETASFQITIRCDDGVSLDYSSPPSAGVERRCVDEDPSPTTTDGDIDDLLDHYSNSDEDQYEDEEDEDQEEYDETEDEDYLTPREAPSPLPPTLAQGIDLPPFFPNSPNAQRPLDIIKSGLSLPPTTSHRDLQDHIARNSSIIRYLALHLVPGPDINPVEHTTDLAEPSLQPETRRRGYTRLLQAIRSVYWDSGAVNDMLNIVDALSASNRGRRRRDTIPVFRKLRSGDARRKGCLTAAQAHRLDELGFSLLEVVAMKDLPKVVSLGFVGRLIEAAETGALAIARECDILDEDGALLELLSDVEGKVSSSRSEGGGKKSVVGMPSGLRCCVNMDEVSDVQSEEEDEEEDGGMMLSVSSLSSQPENEEDTEERADVTESSLGELESLSKDLQQSAGPDDGPLGEETVTDIIGKRPMLSRSEGSFRALDKTDTILVDEETKNSPGLTRFFQEIGATPVVDADTTVRHNIIQETDHTSDEEQSWGFNLGGILVG
ncbi:hypothetical protein CkaCkLH20_03332 [Colletotrichum karsti]|uniref:Uncharacterized protein n=1 Tax=Colletotrichum karsti TaxID=1095194 RepID=A0A9P6IAT9_9PEZI|nr:uncharacterized protein CkaCkLH20_03332 [Colletotrichum karsti]KAF9879099.1 hypothetical protein CkaCkLH20_03332 [Colletotrichum karsti]